MIDLDRTSTSVSPTTEAEPDRANRIPLFGAVVDPLRMTDVVRRTLDWIGSKSHGCRYIVTPNVDHFVMLETHAELQAVYRDASLVIVDGLPVVWASRWVGKRIPERVAGSDLVPALFASAESLGGFRVFLLGAAPGVGSRAAVQIERQWPHVQVVGTYSPPLGFERDPVENENILNRIAGAAPDLLVVGFGAPKQELWVHQHRQNLHARVAICAGATIDFLAGEKRRAPVWMRRVGLEWFHRLASEPRRLAKRYWKDARAFPRLVWREWHATVAPPRASSDGRGECE